MANDDQAQSVQELIKPIFLKWEKLRILYNTILAVELVLLLGWMEIVDMHGPPLRVKQEDGNPLSSLASSSVVQALKR